MQNKLSIKKRMLETIENKGLTLYKFYKDSGVTRGVLEKESGVSEENITKFIVYFPEINVNWLITGEGPPEIHTNKRVQYTTYHDQSSTVNEGNTLYNNDLGSDLITLQRKYIAKLEAEIDALKKRK